MSENPNFKFTCDLRESGILDTVTLSEQANGSADIKILPSGEVEYSSDLDKLADSLVMDHMDNAANFVAASGDSEFDYGNYSALSRIAMVELGCIACDKNIICPVYEKLSDISDLDRKLKLEALHIPPELLPDSFSVDDFRKAKRSSGLDGMTGAKKVKEEMDEIVFTVKNGRNTKKIAISNIGEEFSLDFFGKNNLPIKNFRAGEEYPRMLQEIFAGIEHVTSMNQSYRQYLSTVGRQKIIGTESGGFFEIKGTRKNRLYLHVQISDTDPDMEKITIMGWSTTVDGQASLCDQFEKKTA